MTATRRFEIVGELYRAATGYLRPGKDEPAVTGRDANSDENRERFEQWIASKFYTAALDKIAELEDEVTRLGRRVEDLEDDVSRSNRIGDLT
jgi:hypothetical protein